MRLRTMLTLLSLMAFLSTMLGGVYYYYSLRESAFAVAQRRTVFQTQMIKNQVEAFLSENLKPVLVLAGLPEIRAAAMRPDEANLNAANRILDHFKESLAVDVCYLMDRFGHTIASSNRGDPDSFVGENFSFRPYFKEAMTGKASKYMALGWTSKKRGAYYSQGVYDPATGDAVGVAVIKAPIREMEENIIQSADGIVLLTGPKSVIFCSNREAWLYHTFERQSEDDLDFLARSRQFGEGPWDWVGLVPESPERVTSRSGEEFFVHAMDIANFAGWRIIHLTGIRQISEQVLKPLVRTTSWIVLSLIVLAGVAVYYLNHKASLEILRRRTAERDLRASEERYRSLYHNTPVLLHSIDSEGRLVSISDYWSDFLGYTPQEVIGRKLVDLLDHDSRALAETVTMPEFFKHGVCKDVPYRFVKKNGEMIDVLLSAIAERDDQDRFKRSLAVLVDITERKRAEEQLKEAKEQLSIYSRDLERQVRERTREITGLLNYTPAVVYMKDTEGRYILVNSRHEQLFGIRKGDIVGLTVFDVFPPDIADQFRRNDLRVLGEKRPYQSEETFPNGRFYLSVRFPILDEKGEVNRLCGISVDITELKQAQTKLRRLSGSIISNQEKERTAIARELHDELGQVLTALRIDAVWLKDRLLESDAKASGRAADMCDLIDTTITEVGNIAKRLRPALLDDLGLMEALEWHTTDFEKRTGIVTVFKKENPPWISEVKTVAVYRIVQEALTNAARHSEATHVDVTLKVRDDQLLLTIADNGLGFDPDRLTGDDQFGLAGMRERAYLVGGDLEIRSRPGQGAEVLVTVPIKSDEVIS